MAVELVDYVDSLKREVQPLGDDSFESIDEDTWVGYLVDGFWQARLDELLEAWTCSEEGSVTPQSGSADIPRQFISLIVIYAAIQILRNQILLLATSFRAKAGEVEYEESNAATVLRELLQQLKAKKDQLLAQLDVFPDLRTDASVIDAYSQRQQLPDSYYGTLPLV